MSGLLSGVYLPPPAGRWELPARIFARTNSLLNREEVPMFHVSRRDLVVGAAGAFAAFGLDRRVALSAGDESRVHRNH
jgi:hypothetical protein